MYYSDFYDSVFSNDDVFSPLAETLYVKENVFEGISITTGNGSTIAEIAPNVTGGMTADFGNGQTATIQDNIYQGTTIDMPGLENDIVGRPSVFGGESFTQNGDFVGTLSPSQLGEGYQLTGNTGENIFTTSTAVDGSTKIDINSFATTDFGTSTNSSFDIADNFSGLDAVSSQFSVTEFGSATDVMDGIDILGMF